MDLTPPWRLNPRDASDVARARSPDTSIQASGGRSGDAGLAGAGGTGGRAEDEPVDSESLQEGAQGEAGRPAVDDALDVPVAGEGAPDAQDGGPRLSVDAAVDGDRAGDGPADLPLGSGDARDPGGETLPDSERGGQTGSGGATHGGATGSGAATGKGGAGGTPPQGTGGSGTGGSGTGGGTVADGALSACTGSLGGGTEPGADGGLTTGLVAYYPCEQASATSLPDLSGNNRNATLSGTVGGTGGATGTRGYSFAAGPVNNALFLAKDGAGCATLPAGILAGACEMTVASWVYVNSQVAWQRVWDFGKDQQVCMYLTPSSGTPLPYLRFAITTGGSATEQTVDAPATLPVGVWQHVAVVLGPAGAILYLNGDPVGANPSMTLRPADLGSTPNNYIGRSQFSWDPYFDGDIDELRIYNRALSADAIKALFAYAGS